MLRVGCGPVSHATTRSVWVFLSVLFLLLFVCSLGCIFLVSLFTLMNPVYRFLAESLGISDTSWSESSPTRDAARVPLLAWREKIRKTNKQPTKSHLIRETDETLV